jgi:hypothetical protein
MTFLPIDCLSPVVCPVQSSHATPRGVGARWFKTLESRIASSETGRRRLHVQGLVRRRKPRGQRALPATQRKAGNPSPQTLINHHDVHQQQRHIPEHSPPKKRGTVPGTGLSGRPVQLVLVNVVVVFSWGSARPLSWRKFDGDGPPSASPRQDRPICLGAVRNCPSSPYCRGADTTTTPTTAPRWLLLCASSTTGAFESCRSVRFNDCSFSSSLNHGK